jgi:integrase
MADLSTKTVAPDSIVVSGHTAHHALLSRMALPLVNGRVPLGAAVADTLLEILNRYSISLSETQRTAVGQLTDWMVGKSFDPHRGTSTKHTNEIHPLHGKISAAPHYASLVRQVADIPELDGLRAIVIAYVTGEEVVKGSQTLADSLARLIRVPGGVSKNAPIERINQALLAPVLSAEDLAHDLSSLLGTDAGKVRNIVARLFPVRQSPPPDKTVDEPPAPKRRPPQFIKVIDEPIIPEDFQVDEDEPLDEQVLVDEWRAPSLSDASPIDPDDQETGYNEIICIDEHITPAIADFLFAERTHHHLKGLMLPDTERVLSRLDSRRLWSELSNSMAGAAMNPSLVTQLAADVVISLMLTTGRSRRTCASALLSFLQIQPHGNDAFVLTADRWEGLAPICYPGISDAPESWFFNTSANVTLQLPADLAYPITQLRMLIVEQAHRWTLSLSETNLAERFKAYKRMVPAVSETRVMNCLPIAIYAQTGHSRESQLIAGDDAFRSTASLHYPYYEQRRVQKIYNAALESLGIEPATREIPDQAERYVGARRGAMKPEQVRRAVLALANKTELAVNKGKALSALVDGHNALAAYTCILFGFATANRFTETIGTVTRRDIVACGPTGYDPAAQGIFLALVHDKGKARAIDQRTCALPNLVGAQIKALLQRSQRLRQRLAREIGKTWATVQKALDASIAGDGPIWFGIDEESRGVYSLNRGVLKEYWPEFEPPIQWARHLFASHIASHGMAGGDIAQSMGHSIDSPAFDSTDPDSPIDFGIRCAEAVADYLRSFGFHSIGDIKNRQIQLPEPVIRSPKEILHQASRDDRVVAELNEAESTSSADDISKAMLAVDAFLQRQELHPKYVVDPLRIDDWLSSDEVARKTTRSVQAAIRSTLSNQLIALANTADGKLAPAIPMLRKRQWALASIREVHFDALAWARHAHETAIKRLTQAGDRTERLEIVCGTVLLACWGVATHKQRLVELLSGRTTLHSAPEMGAHAAACCSIAEHDDRYTQTQIIPAVALPLLARLRVLASTGDPGQILDEAWEQTHKFLSELKQQGAAHRVEMALAVISFARQVTTGGDRAAWERGALDAVGPEPGRFFSALQQRLTQQEIEIGDLHDLHRARPLRIEAGESGRLFKRMRSSLYKVRTLPNSGPNRRRLAGQIREITKELPPTCVIGVMASLVSKNLDHRRLAWQSIYHYVTTLTPLAMKIGAIDFSALDDDLFIEHARPLLLSFETSGNRRQREQSGSVVSALAWLIDGFDTANVDLDLGDITAGIKTHRLRKAGYWISRREEDWVLDQLDFWTEFAYRDSSQLGRAQDFASAELATRLQLANALRQGEVSNLKIEDLHISGAYIQTNVRPRASHALKRKASKRPAQSITSKTNVARVLELVDRLQNRHLNTNGELLSTGFRMSRTSIAARNTAMLRDAGIAVIPRNYLRSHIARHNFASAVGLLLRKASFTGLALNLPHSDHLKTYAISALPVRVQLSYFSRQLGHGHPHSTLEWYDHTLALVTMSARHWKCLSVEIQAILLGAGMASYRKAAYRFEHSKTAGRPPWIKYVMCEEHPTPISTSVEFRPPSTIGNSKNTKILELIGEVAMGMRQGLNLRQLANEIGLSEHMCREISADLAHYDDFLETTYLVQDKYSKSETSRRPRSAEYLPAIRQIDQSLEDGYLQMSELLNWCEVNLASKQKPSLYFRSEDSTLLQILSAWPIPKDKGRKSTSAASILLPAHARNWLLLVLYTAVMRWVKNMTVIEGGKQNGRRDGAGVSAGPVPH